MIRRTCTELTVQLRVGGRVMINNAKLDFLDFVRDSLDGFVSVTLSLDGEPNFVSR
jgi:hypothetical protein